LQLWRAKSLRTCSTASVKFLRWETNRAPQTVQTPEAETPVSWLSILRDRSNTSSLCKSKLSCPRIRCFYGQRFLLCLATHCGRVAECHLPPAAMSAGCHFPLPRPPTEEGLRHVMPQLRFPASTVQFLSVSKQRKRPSREYPLRKVKIADKQHSD
jgi:hypothetical protein